MSNNVHCLSLKYKVFSNGDALVYVFQLIAFEEGINLDVLFDWQSNANGPMRLRYVFKKFNFKTLLM